jgi:hypothetical protein
MQFPEFVDLTCRRVTELAGAYMASSGLTVEERARFEQHLHACTWCMTYVQQLGQTARATARLGTDTPVPDTAQLLALFRNTRRSAPPEGKADELSPVDPPPSRKAATPDGEVADRIAFKFLARRAVGPLSGHRWEMPDGARAGGWLEVEGPLVPCRTGVHACRASELAHWLHDELWLVELGEPVTRGIDALVARRGRLLAEVTAWSAGGASRFAAAAHDHAAERVVTFPAPSVDARRCLEAVEHFCTQGDVAMSAYCAAMAVARLVGVTQFDQQAFDLERRWQSSWITDLLGLDGLRASAERARAE